jgi:hypothetical protein
MNIMISTIKLYKFIAQINLGQVNYESLENTIHLENQNWNSLSQFVSPE